MSGHPRLLALLYFFGLTALVYVISGLITATSVDVWYRTLAKPWFNPADWVFAPVWSILFLMFATGGWLAWRRTAAPQKRAVVVAFGVQLALNGLWTVLFFGLHQVALALIDVILLFVSTLWIVFRFWPIDRRAALLFVPYAAWVAFAIALNAAIWHLN